MSSSLALFTPTFLATFLLLNLLAVTPANSWFDKGHRIVGLIAQAHLTVDARKEIERILPGGMDRCLRDLPRRNNQSSLL
ncbi:MAG: hypothetical protein ACXW53_22875, partial [Candidatus Binatia bacterium]